MKNTFARAFSLLFAVCSLLLIISCGEERATAILHDGDDIHAIAYSSTPFELDVASPQCFVYDAEEKCFAFAKGGDKVVYPGSTSKLLTALYALTILSPDTVITAGDELDFVKPGSSIAYIKKGHRLSVEMLIGGMLIPSGNDAAYVLAAAVGREISGEESSSAESAIESYLVGVNEYAREIGLCGTKVTVPDGYDDERHYTTIEDLAIIARLACENDIVSKYAAMAEVSVTYASGHTNTWVNTNRLLEVGGEYYSPFARGLKTGSIMGEYSLIFSFELEDGREYIAGVFGADGKNIRFADALEIIDDIQKETGSD